MAGQSMRDIRRRIASIKSIQQITRAMEMVATAKLRRAQQRAVSSRMYSDGLQRVLGQLVACEKRRYGSGAVAELHPLLVSREPNKICYVGFTGDRGLSGGYNANVNRYLEDRLQASQQAKLMIIGRKGLEHFRHRNYEILNSWVGLGDEPQASAAREIAARLVNGYLEDEFDVIRLVYTRTESAVSQKVVEDPLLPISLDDLGGEGVKETGRDTKGEGNGISTGGFVPDYIYEPSPQEVFDTLFPRYVENLVYRALLEAKASEFLAQMLAMRNATENADEMVKELTLLFNRARQAGITTEISEIVGGAEALQNL